MIDKHYVKRFWFVLRFIVKRSPWLAWLITIIFSFMIVLIVEGRRGNPVEILYMSEPTLLAISGSLLASSVFWVVNRVISLLNTTNDGILNDYFEQTHDSVGLKKVYDQRGGKELLDIYKDLLQSSKERIWAIGMTNQAFTSQHLPIIIKKCERQNGIDVRLVFWNPQAMMCIEGRGKVHFHEIQSELENDSSSETNWISKFSGIIDRIKTAIGSDESLRTQIQIYLVSIVTNISCFVIDDDVFFFPFLSRSSSNLDPHMRFDATTGVGKLIIEHYEKVLRNPSYSEKVEI